MSLFKGLLPLQFRCRGRIISAHSPLRPVLVRPQHQSQSRYRHGPRPKLSPRSVKQQSSQAPSTVDGTCVESQAKEDASNESGNSNVKVKYLRPTIWAIVVSGAIFTELAILQAKRELKASQDRRLFSAPQWPTQKRGPPSPSELAIQAWTQSDPISKLSTGIIAANCGVHVSKFIVPYAWRSLWHMPALNRNFTLFSSVFVHSGAFHLFVNMYCTYNFMLPVAYSRAFEGNPYQMLSFFLGTGVLASLGQHLSTVISTRASRGVPEIFIRCGGASGALLAMLGVFCTQYPHAGLGIILLPFHFEAQYVLPAVMLFDLVGMVRGYSFINLGHAAHLSGALMGTAYSFFDGNNNLWKPLVRFWKRQLTAR